MSPIAFLTEDPSLSLCIFHKSGHTTDRWIIILFLGGETTSRRIVLRAADDLQDSSAAPKGEVVVLLLRRVAVAFADRTRDSFAQDGTK